MGDLSWNPSSWTVSNFAESAVEFVTGSEAAGDVAGLAGAWLTGDALGIASQAGDLGTNIMGGLGTLFDGVGKAAQDAWKEFSNPGSIREPNASQCTCGGYNAGEANGPHDTGAFGGQSASQGIGGAGGLDAEIDAIMKGGGSIEDKIFALLMALQRDKKAKVGKAMDKFTQLTKDAGKAADSKADNQHELGADKDAAMQAMQKEMGELSQLTQLASNLQSSFKQMKDSVIQNIR